MRYRAVLLGLAAATLAAASDSNGIAGPVSGFVLDGRAHTIRAIEGLPGAARLGASVPLPFGVAAAAIATRQDYALAVAVRGTGRPVIVRGLRSGAPEIASIENVIDASLFALASSGAAVLYSQTRHQLQFLTGLPDAPAAAPPVDASVLAGGAVALAIDSAGTSALAAAADGQIYLAESGAAPRAVARLDGASSVAMLPDTDSGLAASGSSGDVIVIDGLHGAIATRALGGAGTALGAARSVGALGSGTAGVIAADGRLAAVDVASGSIEWIGLAGAARSFESLDRTRYVLNRAGDGPLLLLDTAQGRSAWFVPAEGQPAIGRRPGKTGTGGEDRPY